MICPKCSAETIVLSTRKEVGGTILRRRRACNACGHEFGTTESTIDVARQRAAWARAKRYQRLTMPEEQRKALNKRRALLDQSRAEAKATGRPVAEIRREWGIAPRPNL